MFEYLTGIYNITPTPFRADGSLDETSLAKLTEFTRGTRVNGMTILGVLGEADKLTEGERDRVTEIVIETAGDTFPICVGTTHAGTDGCIYYSKRAQQQGAKAVMVAPPKLARSNDAALERHYLAVAEAVDIPVVVQDFPPAVGGITMSVELIAKLAAASPRLSFLKLEDDPAPMKITQIRAISKRGQDLRRTRRHDVPRGAAARRDRHHDRLSRSRKSWSRSSASSPPAIATARPKCSTSTCRSSASRTSRASTWRCASTSTTCAA